MQKKTRTAVLTAALTMALMPLSAQAARDQAVAFPSTYQPLPSQPVLISGATVLDGAGARLDNADVLMVDGRIAGVGTGLQAPDGTLRIDGSGKWVTPGIIDVHSHLGV